MARIALVHVDGNYSSLDEALATVPLRGYVTCAAADAGLVETGKRVAVTDSNGWPAVYRVIESVEQVDGWNEFLFTFKEV